MVTKYRVATQLVTIRSTTSGERIREARKSGWAVWGKHANLKNNIMAAIRYVVGVMRRKHVGGIVVIFPVGKPILHQKIFQAKWGTDNKPFMRFDGVVGHYWYNLLRRENPAFIKSLK